MARIAVVGAGISGLTCAWLLGRSHEVVVFEAEDYIGGHTHTVTVSRPEGEYSVDTGFIVFNDRTYPNFNKLLDQLGIGRQETAMGFAVSAEATGVEYCGDGLGGVFAQRRNLFSPAHWRMVFEILRFNRQAPELLASDEGELPLGEYLRRNGYSDRFLTHYILAMGGAIWSCGEAQMASFPARFFVQFFHNHGLLALRNRPQWYVVPGGSRTYVDRMLEDMPAVVRPGTPAQSVRRFPEHVAITTQAHGEEHFDQVVMACHSDQASALLADIDAGEKRLLDAIPYQANDVVLHTDASLMPRNRRTWSSWNALLPAQGSAAAQVTYNMNILQGIASPVDFCVTLNATDRIDPASIIGQWRFDHPVFTPEGVQAKEEIARRNGSRRTWFCGAWCRYGFHEDGVVSALAVAEQFGEQL